MNLEGNNIDEISDIEDERDFVLHGNNLKYY